MEQIIFYYYEINSEFNIKKVIIFVNKIKNKIQNYTMQQLE